MRPVEIDTPVKNNNESPGNTAPKNNHDSANIIATTPHNQ